MSCAYATSLQLPRVACIEFLQYLNISEHLSTTYIHLPPVSSGIQRYPLVQYQILIEFSPRASCSAAVLRSETLARRRWTLDLTTAHEEDRDKTWQIMTGWFRAAQDGLDRFRMVEGC